MQTQPRPRGRAARALVEASVRARIAGDRLEEVVGGIRRLELLGVLAAPPVPQQDQVAGPRRELLAPEQLLRAPADRKLTDRPLAAVENRVGERLGLVDRRHGLWLETHLLPSPVEL